MIPRPVGAAHFHHGLRGADADADAAFSAALCARLGVPCVVGLGAAQPNPGESPNAAARRARYDFLTEAARDLGADTLATAHTRDDQAETVLGRILRGTSVDGLAGIPAQRDLGDGLTVVRPLLAARRADIEAYCAACGVTPRRDPSNENRRYTRSRLRQCLPELAAEFNPQLTDALVRLAEQAAKDSDYFSDRVEAYLSDPSLVERSPSGDLRLRVPDLQALHPALRGRVLLRVLHQAAPDAISAEKAGTTAFVERLEVLAVSAQSEASFDLPGNVRALRRGDYLIVGHRLAAGTANAGYSCPLLVPGETNVAAAHLRLTAWERRADESPQRERRSRTVDMAYNFVDPPPLMVRTARAGERFAPLGMGGRTRTVRDLLAEAGVPAARRGLAPLVARADTGEAVWLIGVCQSEATRVDEAGPQDGRVLRLRAAFDSVGSDSEE